MGTEAFKGDRKMMMAFREMIPEDADAVAQIEKSCFPVPWSRQSFWEEASHEHTLYWLALDEEKVIGYAGCWILAGEAQITNVAISPEYQGKGVGTQLMKSMIEVAKKRGATAMTLEVRPSNASALALYKKFGLKSVGRRKGYYSDNGEDAIIMWNTNL